MFETLYYFYSILTFRSILAFSSTILPIKKTNFRICFITNSPEMKRNIHERSESKKNYLDILFNHYYPN